MRKLQNSANLICGGLLLLLFVYMSVSSYKDYKQQKEIPKRIEKLEEQVKEISRKIKEKYNEPIPYEHNELPHPSRELAQVPIIQEWDNFACVTGAVIVWTPKQNPSENKNRYWNGWKWVEYD